MKFITIFLLLFCMGFPFTGITQSPPPARFSGSVRGMIVDSAGKQDLRDATVFLMPISDSAEIQYVSTDKKRNFYFKNLTAGAYSLLISFQGFQHIR
jgi:hypothetical protein